MITSMALSISTTTVSATHATPTISVSPDFVKAGESYVFTLSVKNNGGDLIENVEITHSHFALIEPIVKLPKDNMVENVDATLSAGTQVVTANENIVTVAENTDVTLPVGTKIQLSDTLFAELIDGATAELVGDRNPMLETNVKVTVESQAVTLAENDLRLLSDTSAALVTSTTARFPEDTLVEVPADVNTNVSESITLVADNTVTLATDNENAVVADVRLLAQTRIKYTTTDLAGGIVSLDAGTEVDIGDNVSYNERVVLPAGTEVTATGAPVTVAENTDVTVLAGTVVTLPSGTVPEDVPAGWSFSSNMWSGTADNIAVGETVEFPFAATAPTDGNYDIIVKTTDINGYEANVVISLTSDGTPPSVTAAVSPSLVGLATVTITVQASEKLSKLGKVTVTQDNAIDENVFTIGMTSADGINWTGTYTVISDHDNVATVAIENSTDLAGNAGGENNSVATFTVDTIPPAAPIAVAVPTNDGEVILLDNFVNQPNQLVYGVSTEAEVLVRVNSDVISVTPRTDDNYSVAITLLEGTNEVGVSLVDLAGNASVENVQEVVLDSLPPTVAVVSIAGKGYAADMAINDNTPKIVAKMLDAVSGVKRENSNVVLVGVGTLENANVWDPETGLIENTVPSELSEGTHTITITAVDKSGVNPTVIENFTFVVDVTAPTMPSTLDAVNNPVLYGTSAINPKVQKATALVLYGSDLEGLSTVKIYLIDQATGTGISTVTTTADAGGNFSKSVTLSEGKVVRIEVETIDAAGNVSSRLIYGYAMADATAPSVTLVTPPETTDKTSITISGTVSKDAWEDWSDITLTVQVGTGRVVVPIGAGGSYNYSLALSEGPNTIVVQASDSIGNASAAVSATVERTVTPWMTYAIVLVIIALLMAVIAIFRK